MKMFTAAAMVCILSLLPNEQLQGQQRLTVSDKPSCAACTIELTRVTRLGGPLDSLYFDLGAAVIARDRRGRIYIGPREPLGPAAVTVYDSAGRYITALARRGMGPGEIFSLRTFLLTPQDSLVLFDRTKMVVLSPSYELVREEPSTSPSIGGRSLVRLSNGNIVIPASIASSDRAGYPLHLSSRNGILLNSFGAEVPLVRPDRPYEIYRTVGWAGGNMIWSAHDTRYQLELWDVAGSLRKTLVRETSWFQPWGTANEMFTHPRVGAVRQDAEGLVWTIVKIPDTTVPFNQIVGPAGSNRLYDTLIEVIDPENGVLLASRRFAKLHLRGFWSGSLLSSVFVDADDTPYIDIWEVKLKRP
jgi:hypothetical protein